MVGLALGVSLSALCLSLSAQATPVRLVKRADPVPDFVLANAPVSHLYSGESWWPGDVAEHVTHMIPEVDFDAVAPSVTLLNISSLASDVFLTSKDDVTTQPSWITNAVATPDSTGLSTAPATIVLVNKPGDILDAFFFYFYSFNHGGKASTYDRSDVLVRS